MTALTKDQIAKAIAENVGLQRNRSIELVEVLDWLGQGLANHG